MSDELFFGESNQLGWVLSTGAINDDILCGLGSTIAIFDPL